MNKIHPTAIIEDGAKIGDNVEIGAYSYIGAEVEIGDNCSIAHHATVDGYTIMGKANQIFPYAFIGGKTHDLKFVGGSVTGLKIGDNNVFREYSTAHCATKNEEFTIVGNNNNILAYSHIAHDCIVGNNIVMSSHAALGGHVIVEDNAVIGWGSGIHQFCRVGAYAMLSASSKQVKDLAPFFLADGNPAAICAVNKVNMQRNGFTVQEIDYAFSAFKLLYKRHLPRNKAIDELAKTEMASNRVIKAILDFAHSSSERGLI
ncbi:MAG: acyl-ACP--UDP-N-acetylglucosamine O-acyltransferase [Opitutales bacterium]